MYARVIPIRRLPAELKYFDYSVPADMSAIIKAGDLVQIPFRASKIWGVVWQLTDQTDEKSVKPIELLTDQGLTGEQFQLLECLHQNYYLPLSLLIRWLIYTQPLKIHQLRLSQPAAAKKEETKSLGQSISHGWLIYQRFKDLKQYLAVFVKPTSKGQTLILVPEHYLSWELQKIWPNALIMPARSQKNFFWQAWQKSSTAPIIIGNIQAAFLPFSKLKQIIVIEAENPQFNQPEQSPRLHLADLIEPLEKIYRCSILLTSQSPTVELIHLSKRLNYPTKQLKAAEPATYQIVDKQDERAKKNFSLLSEAAEDTIQRTKGKILLYLNQLGYNRLTVCSDCGWQARCPNCHNALIEPIENSDLVCWNCKRTSIKPLTCPICHGARLRNRLAGLEQLAKEVSRLFPDKNIAVIDKLTSDNGQAADIVLATSTILSRPMDFELTVMINTDLDLSQPDFQAAQNLRRQILKLRANCRQLIVQTSYPEHYIFSSLDSIEKFYTAEMDWRKQFDYPPIVESIAWHIKATDENNLVYIVKLLKTLFLVDKIAGFSQQSKEKTTGRLILRGLPEQAIIDNIPLDIINKISIECNPYDWQ